MALVREQLDQMRCGVEHPSAECDHDELYFHARCHMKAPTWAVYSGGVLRIECSECGNEVAAIRVARGKPQGRR